jgi:2-methylisocitrate lyase-like PEP mutase family enzyme
VLYAPGLTSADDIARVVKAVDAPINVLMMSGTPSPATLARLGVRRASVGGALARAAYAAAERRAGDLLRSMSDAP